ncbi:uncharacterized protein [Rutidosis leptorrhynchoides]|uniref:uncharacterized protein n=1 Tax=Rutidosis leptorrhynchoides TaxID=125765 RepID=UPI003A99A71C
MKFKKGSKVEVMNKVAPTSWRVAEIMSGNGLDYNVRYDGYEDVEKVSRRFIRPSPPAISSQRWVSGDIVEVFVENSWKVATVSKVLKGGQFLVRSHEFTREMKIHRTYIRVPQSWVDDQWVPVGKISGSYGVEPNFSLKMGTQRCEEREDRLAEYNDARLQESRKPKTLKRASPFCSSIIQAKKFKPAEKDGKQRHVSGHSFKKVDAFEGNTYMNNSLNGYYEMKKRKTNGVGCNDHVRISEPNDSDNDLCSVGSCSVPCDDPNKLTSQNDADFVSSDGESSSTSRDEHELAVSIHRLELHAYRSTLEALYASGPLSWEKEALLTNLRISLHISNDEHLIELKNLISSGAGYS